MPEWRKERYWSRLAQGYDEGVDHIVGEAIQQEIAERLSEERDLGEVLEFGCGTGYFTKVIAHNADCVVATDLSDEMLEVAAAELKGFPNVTVQKADCENASLPSGGFDTVFMANVIHFIESPLDALLESYRILKDGGLLLLVDYTGYGMKRSEKLRLGLRFIRVCGLPPRHGRPNLSPDELRLLVEGAGFLVERVRLIGEATKALYLKGRKPEAADSGGA